MVNDSPGAKYLEEIFWTASGKPAKGDWYTDPHLSGQQAVRAAARQGAYFIWGLPLPAIQAAEPDGSGAAGSG